MSSEQNNPQPTAGGDAPTDRASPIQPYGPDDDENIFALLCARKDARTDTSAKAIAWAEDEIENLRSERNDLVTKVNALSAERARVIEECAKLTAELRKLIQPDPTPVTTEGGGENG